MPASDLNKTMKIKIAYLVVIIMVIAAMNIPILERFTITAESQDILYSKIAWKSIKNFI